MPAFEGITHSKNDEFFVFLTFSPFDTWQLPTGYHGKVFKKLKWAIFFLKCPMSIDALQEMLYKSTVEYTTKLVGGFYE